MADGGDAGVDGLLREFLLETRDTLDAVETYRNALIEDPADADAQKRLLEMVHAVKGACGFLPLPRLEAVAAAVTGAADTLNENGRVPTSEAMAAILTAIGRMRDILDVVDHDGAEPPGGDDDLIEALVAIAEDGVPITDDAGPGLDAAAQSAADFAAVALMESAAGQDAPSFYVIFRAGDDGPMALDAAHVAWLDLVETVTIASDGIGEAMVRGEPIALYTADGEPVGVLAEAKSVIVLIDGERRIGLVVDEIIDVATDPAARIGSPVAIVEPARFLDK